MRRSVRHDKIGHSNRSHRPDASLCRVGAAWRAERDRDQGKVPMPPPWRMLAKMPESSKIGPTGFPILAGMSQRSDRRSFMPIPSGFLPVSGPSRSLAKDGEGLSFTRSGYFRSIRPHPMNIIFKPMCAASIYGMPEKSECRRFRGISGGSPFFQIRLDCLNPLSRQEPFLLPGEGMIQGLTESVIHAAPSPASLPINRPVGLEWLHPRAFSIPWRRSRPGRAYSKSPKHSRHSCPQRRR